MHGSWKGKAGETPQTYLENKWLSNSSIQKKTGPNNGTKVVSKEAIRMQQTGALLWLYAWRNEAGNPTLQLYQQKMEEHER